MPEINEVTGEMTRIARETAYLAALLQAVNAITK